MGRLLGLFLFLLAAASVYLFLGQDVWQFPETISAHGPAIDAQFNRTLVVVGIAFVLAQVALGYIVFRYGRRGAERATYTHGSNRLEATWTFITAAVFVALAILGQRVWANLHLDDPPAGSIKISVVGQQFRWNFHYPGVDNVPGRTAAQFIDEPANYVGVDPKDPNSKDDVQAAHLAIPVNRPVELMLRSKDVIHSFFVPHLRFKQDLVPGMNIRVYFVATKVGQYEIPCAELCGNQHFFMKAYLLVLPEEEYDALVAMPEEKFNDRIGELRQQYKTQ